MAHALFWLSKVHNQDLIPREKSKNPQMEQYNPDKCAHGANGICTWLTFA